VIRRAPLTKHNVSQAIREAKDNFDHEIPNWTGYRAKWIADKIEGVLGSKRHSRAFAQTMGVSHQSVRMWANGRSVPRRHLMLKIGEPTDGQVGPDAFFQLTRTHRACLQTRDAGRGQQPCLALQARRVCSRRLAQWRPLLRSPFRLETIHQPQIDSEPRQDGT
jgi:hypothetical protein